MSERWADIDGFDGRYQVSTRGHVRSFAHDKINGRLLKITHYPNGYAKVQLGAGGPQLLVHRLVAKAFIPGDHMLQVNHLNGVRDDNRVENLEWLSCSDNHRHSYRELNRKQHALSRETILVCHGEELVFPSLKSAATHLNSDVGTLSKCRRHGYKAKGYEVHAAI